MIPQRVTNGGAGSPLWKRTMTELNPQPSSLVLKTPATLYTFTPSPQDNIPKLVLKS